MNTKSIVLSVAVGAFIIGVVHFGAHFLLPWYMVNWGSLHMLPGKTVTVSGEASTQTKSQLATFTAGVSAVNDNRQTATDEVSQKITAVVEAVKAFGIPAEDIKTQNISVFQQEEQYYDDSGSQKFRSGQWRVSNNIDITLRDVDRAQALSDILTASGATTVYGPNFTLDDTGEAENALIEAALTNARAKADIIAKASSKTLGNVVSVNEGAQPVTGPIYARMEAGGGGGAGPIEPGTGTVSKTVTVTFELK